MRGMSSLTRKLLLNIVYIAWIELASEFMLIANHGGLCADGKGICQSFLKPHNNYYVQDVSKVKTYIFPVKRKVSGSFMLVLIMSGDLREYLSMLRC